MLALKRTTTPAEPVPHTVGDDPEVQAARAKLQEIEVELRDKQRRLDQLAEQRPAGGADDVMQQAEAVLRGDFTRSPDMAALIYQGRVLHQAARVQADRVADVERQAMRRIAQAERPAYTALLTRMAHLVAELGALADEETAFRDDLIRRGVAQLAVLDVAPLDELSLRAGDSMACRWLRDVSEAHGIDTGAKLGPEGVGAPHGGRS